MLPHVGLSLVLVEVQVVQMIACGGGGGGGGVACETCYNSKYISHTSIKEFPIELGHTGFAGISCLCLAARCRGPHDYSRVLLFDSINMKSS